MIKRALLTALTLAGAGFPALAAADTPVIGPCDGCELALEGIPAKPPTIGRIAIREEPGDPLRLSGTVTDATGRPRAGVVIYAHQTDAAGQYPAATRSQPHGRLRAWARSDASGHYGFLTVRPGAYPGSDNPQHIHLMVLEPGCALYYIDDVVFRDDPLLTPAQLRRREGRGGDGVTDPVWTDGGWQVRRDIVLGERVPGYQPCAARDDSAAK